MTRSKALSFLEHAQQADQPPNLIRWLMILAAIGLVGSLAIGLLLRPPANAQSNSSGVLPAGETKTERGINLA